MLFRKGAALGYLDSGELLLTPPDDAEPDTGSSQSLPSKRRT
jgi:hypothetical protein